MKTYLYLGLLSLLTFSCNSNEKNYTIDQEPNAQFRFYELTTSENEVDTHTLTNWSFYPDQTCVENRHIVVGNEDINYYHKVNSMRGAYVQEGDEYIITLDKMVYNHQLGCGDENDSVAVFNTNETYTINFTELLEESDAYQPHFTNPGMITSLVKCGSAAIKEQ
ncbi:hypothetical protein MY04_3239 [Flammeovirga sp. MY04]|uniref:hypothetical protein n=1 Tax=Flammeovirga sp. MY04 TaxID=1191459 RepID=UPI0008063405|nr:hypothetical protein [Flammeovirga sp. MY04]ANQ50604.1 hypothetical protein MY04_3239 [Flammeovirga sp. MY04]